MMSASARSGFLKAQPIGFKQLAGRQREDLVELLEPREEIRAVHEKSQVDRRRGLEIN